MKIITISGHAQNGKDTVANIIRKNLIERQYDVLVTHYADLLKYICKTFFDWDGNKDEHGRHILQYVGTDIIRKKDPDFWVDFISSVLKFFDNYWDWVIIPDTRFPNEIDKLKSNGFDVTHIRVERANYENSLTHKQQTHLSETALDGITPDYYINNDGSLEDLESLISDWIEEILYEG